MPPLIEVGKTYNKRNFTLLKDAYKALKTAIANFGDVDSEDDTEEKDAKEAQGFSANDLATRLQAECNKMLPDCRVVDIFPDDTTCVCAMGWLNVKYCQCTYTIDDNGNVTCGPMVDVARKVTYTTLNADTPAETIQDTSMGAMESQRDLTIVGDPISLVEAAVSADNTVMLKLIAPGWGSSGYYSKEVLQRDGPKVFKAGTHNFIDHPTAQEETARPEGSLTNLGSTLTEDAKWLDDYKGYGPGLYAKAQVTPTFKETLNVIAPNIGTSIRASGTAKIGVAENRKGPIIEAITLGKSVDYVTKAGAGGKVLTLMESARSSNTSGVEAMAVNETDFRRLEEANQALQLQVMRMRSTPVITQRINSYSTLPQKTRQRLIEQFISDDYQLPISEAGTLDMQALSAAIDNAAQSEASYLASLGVGRVRGLGNSKPSDLAESDPAKFWDRIDKEFANG